MTQLCRTPPKVQAALWHYRDGAPSEAGARIYFGSIRVFVPASGIRVLADRLHDAADKIEQEQNQ